MKLDFQVASAEDASDHNRNLVYGKMEDSFWLIINSRLFWALCVNENDPYLYNLNPISQIRSTFKLLLEKKTNKKHDTATQDIGW